MTAVEFQSISIKLQQDSGYAIQSEVYRLLEDIIIEDKCFLHALKRSKCMHTLLIPSAQYAVRTNA